MLQVCTHLNTCYRGQCPKIYQGRDLWKLLRDTILTHIMWVPFSGLFLDAILLRGLLWCYPLLPGQYTFRAVTAGFRIPHINHPLITRHFVSPHLYHPFIELTISQVNEVASFFHVLTSKWKYLIIFLSTFILVAEEELPFFELDLFSFSYDISVSEYKFRIGGVIIFIYALQPFNPLSC
jgi:hypothetical protein